MIFTCHNQLFALMQWEVRKMLRAAIPNLFGTKDRFCGRQFSRLQGGCRRGKWFQFCPPLNSCGVAQFLTDSELVPVHGSGVGDPWVAAAAAKSLQSCLTLCDPIDSSPQGYPVPGILQARTLEWVAISFSNAGK